MQTNKKKPNIPLIIVGAILAVIAGYLVNGAWKQGMEFSAFISSLNDVLSNPLRDYFNRTTFKAIVAALFTYSIIVIMYYTSQYNMMPGKEYGSARLAHPMELNRVLSDPEIDNNRILSQKVRMSINSAITSLNNNIFVIGGSGAGKSYRVVMPNVLQGNSSMILTDPKGELYRKMSGYLKKMGYVVKCINLLEMEKSDCYNPFVYIRKESDVVKLVTALMTNTTPKNSAPNDPFWDKSEGMLLQALFYYVWLEKPPAERNMNAVLELLSEAEVTDKDSPSELDIRMATLEAKSPLGKNHPAVKQYNKCMRGAGDTVRSIIISANARLAKLENDEVKRLLSKDDLNIDELGIGVNGDGITKTALFCIIPDSDKSYNFIVGLLYTQIFQELYFQADFVYDGPLPVPVTFMLDEFCNVALPEDFTSLISTMRSRNISSVIIIQNMAQIKALFKDTWENITGNCDTTIYLGGNEASTHEYISKLLGKMTIDKKSTGLSKGRQGSSSQNMDVIGREIMTPDEVRMMDNKKCLVFVKGHNPVMDDKYDTQKHPRYELLGDDEGHAAFVPYLPDHLLDQPYNILTEAGMKRFTSLQEKGENIYIDRLEYNEFMLLDDEDFRRNLMENAEAQKVRDEGEVDTSLHYVPDEETEQSLVAELLEFKKQVDADRGKQDGRQKGSDNTNNNFNDDLSGNDSGGEGEDNNKPSDDSGNSMTLRKIMAASDFTPEQKKELERAVKDGVPEEYIMTYADPENSVIKMMTLRRQYQMNANTNSRNDQKK